MNIMGIIFAYSDRENLRELTKRRTLGALPLSGKYRIIDFALSNYVNSGIYDVAVITRRNYHSLIDHLGQGKEWDLMRKRGGLRILTPYGDDAKEKSGLYRGSIEALENNLQSFRRAMADYVIMTGTSILYSIDYTKLVQSHIDRGADITVLYSRQLNGYQTVPMGVQILRMDEEERVYDLSVNVDDVKEQDVAWSLDCFVIKKSLMETLVADATAYKRYDFYEDIIRRLAPRLKILGYEYKQRLLEISSAPGYMKANKNFLEPEFRKTFFHWPIYTKVKDSVPALYLPGCQVKRSIISDECRIEGKVENSVISRGVRIGRNAVVKDCIVMQNTEIQNDVYLENVIVDKDVIVRDHRQITGHETYPVVIEKGSII